MIHHAMQIIQLKLYNIFFHMHNIVLMRFYGFNLSLELKIIIRSILEIDDSDHHLGPLI